jgi:uncharacterized protein (TIGR00251 family)
MKNEAIAGNLEKLYIIRMLLQIKVIPNASKTELIKTEAGYKARIQCAPVDGKANDALIMLLSKEFGISKSDIEITKGKTSRSKTILLKEE